MLSAFMLLTALSVSNISDADLENYYWDCDTAYMKGSLGGQDMNSCLKITEQFQKQMFNDDKDAFMQYWNDNKNQQWESRGFYRL
jgi:hypothetical protein